MKYAEFRVPKIIRQDGDLPEAIRIFESEGGDVGWNSQRWMWDLPRNKGGMMGNMVDLWDLPLFIGQSTSYKRPFSIAMLNYQRVIGDSSWLDWLII